MTKSKTITHALCGVLIGVINGFFGGGGGMVAVPVLTNVLGYEQKKAHATAILIIAPVCLISCVAYLLSGFGKMNVIIPATVGSVAGGLCGAGLLNKLTPLAVKVIFIIIMLIAGVKSVVG